MKALILRQNADAANATSRELINKGFQILCVETLAVAHALIRVDAIDLLVMDERIAGQLTHAIALSGERKNPHLNAIMLSDRCKSETDELFDLIPALYAILGADVDPKMIGALAMAAFSNHCVAPVDEVYDAEIVQNKVAFEQVDLEFDMAELQPLALAGQSSDALLAGYTDFESVGPDMMDDVVHEDPSELETIGALSRAHLAALLREHMPHAAPVGDAGRISVPA